MGAFFTGLFIGIVVGGFGLWYLIKREWVKSPEKK